MKATTPRPTTVGGHGSAEGPKGRSNCQLRAANHLWPALDRPLGRSSNRQAGWVRSTAMTVTLRQAQPTDVDLAIPLIYSSGPDAFSYVFAHATKGDARAFLGQVFVDGRGTFGYRNHTVAESNGEVVGIGATYSGEGSLSTTAVVAMQILRAYGTAGPGIIGRGLRIERVMPPPGKSVQYIAHLGVNPANRGQGIGTQLIERFLDEGRRRRKKVAALDVSVENPDAERLYERLGFTVSEVRTSNLANEFGMVVDHRRMERTL